MGLALWHISNANYHVNLPMRSRFTAIYLPTSITKKEGSRSRQELSTISDTTLEYMAAKKVFNYVWALHSGVHKGRARSRRPDDMALYLIHFERLASTDDHRCTMVVAFYTPPTTCGYLKMVADIRVLHALQ